MIESERLEYEALRKLEWTVIKILALYNNRGLSQEARLVLLLKELQNKLNDVYKAREEA